MSEAVSPKGTQRGWVPQGTPFQVEQRTRTIVRDLGSEAAKLRRNAARIERLAAKIEANRAAGNTISRELIGEVLMKSRATSRAAAWSAVRKLAGVDWRADERAIFTALWPRPLPTIDPPTRAVDATIDAPTHAELIALGAVPLFDPSTMQLRQCSVTLERVRAELGREDPHQRLAAPTLKVISLDERRQTRGWGSRSRSHSDTGGLHVRAADREARFQRLQERIAARRDRRSSPAPDGAA